MNLGNIIDDAQPRCILTTDDTIGQFEQIRMPGVLVTLISPSGDISFKHLCEKGQEGEICIRGRNIKKGYLNRPEETRSSFWQEWFRSGDVGFLDDSGYLFIVDRIKDLIITGGENVYPREIEEILYTFPDISECAVVGLPDREWGEHVTAMIVPAVGRTIDIDALKSELKKKLSAYKIPKQYDIVEELPKSPSGKILKRSIRKAAQARKK
jgi:long-chain acyl-CoA synthetase